jgi:sulfonate transport system substrate-binding protein
MCYKTSSTRTIPTDLVEISTEEAALSTKQHVGAALLALALVGAACSSTTAGESTTLRLGYFPNLTHATAIVGVEKGFFAKHLGDVKLETKTFNAGGDAVTALFSNALDATYIGPSPAINAFAKSNGEAIRIVSGATAGGAFLVVKPDINEPEDLRGKKLATPQLGNTQDVALRAWLASKGLETTKEGGGDVEVTPQENAQSLETLKSGQIDGAWVPEPWATRLVQEGGGKVLVDEADLWPGGQYVTTHLIVRTEFLKENPDAVKRLIRGHIEADAYVHDHEDEAKTAVNRWIEKITSKTMKNEILGAAWKNLTFTVDPIARSLKESADDAIELELIDPVDLTGIYDLRILNGLLRAAGRGAVKGL